MSISISTQVQCLLRDFHSRRLLMLHAPPSLTPTMAAPTNPETNHPYTGNNSFDANVIMVMSVLLCAIMFTLVLNSIIRCVLRCSSLLASGSGASTSAQPPNRGINRKALKTFPTVNYSADLNMPGLDSECVICLSDFKPGDRVRLLPMCNHGFHVQCINKWLSCRSSCPKCRHCLVETCQKIVVFSSQASSSQPTPVQETAVTIGTGRA
ncbi:hypothetical protein CXB51_026356 [Gossypium anomalum]|uniref:RING-type E3 ubiquitin transferase n=1 Tax=Gossypium anomalum TaxID=47600 RepID=A0A8J5YHM7_9ROSI|nr:hypothetical protein CXB51_026356 [Gossypium anomalum]